MRRTIIALKYAKGLFLVAKELGKFKQFAEELQRVKLLLDSMPEVLSALQNPIYPPDLKMEIINDLLKVLGLDPELERFLRMLVEKRRIQYIDEIVRVYSELVDEELNIARGELITAYPIDEEERKELEGVLSEFLKKEVYLEPKLDESIIGGIKIRIGDLIFDGSMKTQLRKIKETIKGEVLL
ncbi:MAG: ATP synthase F1 subunit delta [Thermodesulfobacteriaceae bacterium]|nr:ATP synthase F1 subunit delta [Thermodesulfobacteriaceae bacterium]MCX8042020.1 ATP synthase F1 subunit delta [Thermodesulfobacteriaceae bacterium]MDW8135367.1 ATP synthase F1 subunit delta [Thermodesulfobacterium sp.]